jgi:hypothetical protein
LTPGLDGVEISGNQIRRLGAVAFLLLVVCAAACSSNGGPYICPSPVTVTEPNSIASVSNNYSCQAADLTIFGNAPAGSACTDPTECLPTCCACSVSGRSAVTSWCNNGVCASSTDTCCALQGTPTNSCGTK